MNLCKRFYYFSKYLDTKKPLLSGFFYILHPKDDQFGALREIRTPDPLVRSQVLYPAEL